MTPAEVDSQFTFIYIALGAYIVLSPFVCLILAYRRIRI